MRRRRIQEWSADSHVQPCPRVPAFKSSWCWVAKMGLHERRSDHPLTRPSDALSPSDGSDRERDRVRGRAATSEPVHCKAALGTHSCADKAVRAPGSALLESTLECEGGAQNSPRASVGRVV